MAWFFANVMNRPEILSKLRSELTKDSTEATWGDGEDTRAVIEENERFRYLRQCIDESLRLTPSVMGAMDRQLLKPTSLGGVQFPPGVHSILQPSSLLEHRFCQYYCSSSKC